MTGPATPPPPPGPGRTTGGQPLDPRSPQGRAAAARLTATLAAIELELAEQDRMSRPRAGAA